MFSKVWNLRYDESMQLKMYGVYSLLLSRSTREPNYIYMYIAHLQAERIGASSMWIAHKTAKLFICLGSSTQLGQSIIINTLTCSQIQRSKNTLVNGTRTIEIINDFTIATKRSFCSIHSTFVPSHF